WIARATWTWPTSRRSPQHSHRRAWRERRWAIAARHGLGRGVGADFGPDGDRDRNLGPADFGRAESAIVHCHEKNHPPRRSSQHDGWSYFKKQVVVGRPGFPGRRSLGSTT